MNGRDGEGDDTVEERADQENLRPDEDNLRWNSLCRDPSQDLLIASK